MGFAVLALLQGDRGHSSILAGLSTQVYSQKGPFVGPSAAEKTVTQSHDMDQLYCMQMCLSKIGFIINNINYLFSSGKCCVYISHSIARFFIIKASNMGSDRHKIYIEWDGLTSKEALPAEAGRIFRHVSHHNFAHPDVRKKLWRSTWNLSAQSMSAD